MERLKELPLICYQYFNPPIRIYLRQGKIDVTDRNYYYRIECPALPEFVDATDYIGQYQIEEVWKKYNNRVYISNLGYVALFETKEEQKEAQKILGDMQRWVDMDEASRNLIFKHTKIPENKYAVGCKVWLYIKGRNGGSVHTMVAEKFLRKPKAWKPDWVVHHIDNNSYNNSVTNLIWLPPETHTSPNHRYFHPMSYKNDKEIYSIPPDSNPKERERQDFNPPLIVDSPYFKIEYKTRFWSRQPLPYGVYNNYQNMDCVGRFQIEEIWKKYNDRIYISNLGYVALFETKEEQKEAQKILGNMQRWVDMDEASRNLIFKHTKIPENKCVPGCKVWLYISGENGGSVHRMVAEKFLKKPRGWKQDWVVHHIDNNSYNNSVANLIWLSPKSHRENHQLLHPMSHKRILFDEWR